MLRIGLRHGSSELRDPRSFRFRVSSEDASLGALPEENEVQAPSFSEFITSERVKVVAMLALALALCNADRVVMSVAIVPLSLSRGWSRSFSGIVQVVFLSHTLSLSLTYTQTHEEPLLMAYGLFGFRERNISKKKTIDAVIELRFSQDRNL